MLKSASMKAKTIYLDHAAATPLDPTVRQAMEPFLADKFYNPSSLYAAGRQTRQAVEAARHQVADILGAKSSEIIFTAGGTESVNLALQGVLTQFPDKRFITSAIEHEAVLATFAELRRRGHKMDEIPVSPLGLADPQALAAAIDDQTVLVSLMLANNEIGTIQPVAAVAKLIAEIRTDRMKRGIELPLYLHTDACQAAGALDLHVNRLGVDLLTINGSKIYGPKQIGALYVRTGTRLSPLIHGGGQEKGLRSGTENVAAIVGLAEALLIAQSNRVTEAHRLTKLRDQLIAGVDSSLPEVLLNGSPSKRLPNNINITIPGIDGEEAVLYLDEAGVQVSTGSACTTGRTEPSHVLLAIGRSKAEANASLRLTLGRSTTATDIEAAIKAINKVVSKLRQLSTSV